MNVFDVLIEWEAEQMIAAAERRSSAVPGCKYSRAHPGVTCGWLRTRRVSLARCPRCELLKRFEALLRFERFQGCQSESQVDDSVERQDFGTERGRLFGLGPRRGLP